MDGDGHRPHRPDLTRNTRKTQGKHKVRHKDYWMRLKGLQMSSQERRMEHYRIFYIWKILDLTRTQSTRESFQLISKRLKLEES
jgi:hypothetical protein